MECITHCHCISHLITSFHHILHCIIPHQTPSLTYSKPHHIPCHTIILHHITPCVSHQHISQHIMPLCNTIFQIAATYASRHISHPISHYIPHNTTFHVLHATFRVTTHWPHYASHHILHRTTFYTMACVCVFWCACVFSRRVSMPEGLGYGQA